MGRTMGRRELVIRVRFEPVRQAGDNLRVAYEQVIPVRRRLVRSPVPMECESATMVVAGREEAS